MLFKTMQNNIYCNTTLLSLFPICSDRWTVRIFARFLKYNSPEYFHAEVEDHAQQNRKCTLLLTVKCKLNFWTLELIEQIVGEHVNEWETRYDLRVSRLQEVSWNCAPSNTLRYRIFVLLLQIKTYCGLRKSLGGNSNCNHEMRAIFTLFALFIEPLRISCTHFTATNEQYKIIFFSPPTTKKNVFLVLHKQLLENK